LKIRGNICMMESFREAPSAMVHYARKVGRGIVLTKSARDLPSEAVDSVLNTNTTIEIIVMIGQIRVIYVNKVGVVCDMEGETMDEVGC